MPVAHWPGTDHEFDEVRKLRASAATVHYLTRLGGLRRPTRGGDPALTPMAPSIITWGRRPA